VKLRRIQAIAVKEALQIVRDPRSLMIALLVPLMQMVIFGYGVNLDIRHIPLCVLDHENGQQSRNLVARFAASNYFSLRRAAGSDREVARALDDGDCGIALVIRSPRRASR